VSARFCSICGAGLREIRCTDDAHPRHHCDACARIEYDNPRVHAGCIVRDAGGGWQLRLAQLAPFEKLQVAALRALGGAGTGVPEEQLALYCTLTEPAAQSAFLVFRLRSDTTLAACDPAAPVPAWAAVLLERHAADSAARQFRVYTGQYDGGALQLQAVPRNGDPA